MVEDRKYSHSMQSLFKHTFRFLALKVRKARIHLSNRPSNDLSYKQQLLLEIGWHYRCSALIETGTFLGDTVEVARHHFDKVASIELHEDLSKLNNERFKKRRNILLLQGDSRQLMPEALRHLKTERGLFWLDAHYSGPGTAKGRKECPVLAELSAIAGHVRNDHCILIDDAHIFGNHEDYPTLDQVRQKLLSINPAFDITVANDIIMALPPK